MFAKHCPHCLKRIPLRKRLRKHCPYCFKAFRRRSGTPQRSLVGEWLEDRGMVFWIFILSVFFGLLVTIKLSFHDTELLMFIEEHPKLFAFSFVLSILYLAMFATTIGRIYFPLMLNAPRIMRVERAAVRQYKVLTTVGLILGAPFAMLFTGYRDFWSASPATAFLFTIPTVLMWAYHALTLSDEDYEDERVWSYLQEIGAADRLEHRHHAYFVLFGIPLSAAIFYFFLTHPYLANMIKESSQSGLIAMFIELWHRTSSHMPAKG